MKAPMAFEEVANRIPAGFLRLASARFLVGWLPKLAKDLRVLHEGLIPASLSRLGRGVFKPYPALNVALRGNGMLEELLSY
jgi:hypothetical protein